MSCLRPRGVVLCAAATLALSVSASAHAATFTVTTTADLRDFTRADGVCSVISGPGPCTLRAAIQQANASPGSDTIVLQKGFVHTLTLRGAGEADSATGDLDVNTNVTFRVAGGGFATVQGNSQWDEFVITVGGDASVRMTGLIIRQGRGGLKNLGTLTVNDGVIEENTVAGGILNQGSLTLVDTVVRDNDHERQGGGIDNLGTLTLDRTHVIRNHAPSGGGIANRANVFIGNSTLSDNSADRAGGGLWATVGNSNNPHSVEIISSLIELNSANNGAGVQRDFGSMRISDSEFDGNVAQNQGGGLSNDDSRPEDGALTVFGSAFVRNEAVNGGGIVNLFGSSLELTSVSLTENFASGNGGGLGNIEADAQIIQSAFVENTSGGSGAGIDTDGLRGFLNVHDSTLSGNRAGADGGGIRNVGELLVRNCTIAFNTADADANLSGGGGGVFSVPSTATATTLANTILASNRDSSPLLTRSHDCAGPIVSGGFNLIQSLAGCDITGDSASNITGVSPRLIALADNGGLTLTHRLPAPSPTAPSPAVDTGAPASVGGTFRCSPTDQRTLVRPRDGNGDGERRCDIGAFEL